MGRRPEGAWPSRCRCSRFSTHTPTRSKVCMSDGLLISSDESIDTLLLDDGDLAIGSDDHGFLKCSGWVGGDDYGLGSWARCSRAFGIYWINGVGWILWNWAIDLREGHGSDERECKGE